MLPAQFFFAKSGIKVALCLAMQWKFNFAGGKCSPPPPYMCMISGFSGVFTIAPKIIRISQLCIKNEGKLFKKLNDSQSYRHFQ